MWKYVLSPQNLGGPESYSHVWLVDSDMDVHPDRFDAATFIQVSEATNVSILAPSPYGGGFGMFAMHNPRCLMDPAKSRCDRYCMENPARLCAVCRHPMVEVKAPLFTELAWHAWHQHVMHLMPDYAIATSDNFDKHWCNFMVEHVYGCEWSKRPKGYCTKHVGKACAYSYVTPIRHLDERTAFVHDGSIMVGKSQALNSWLDSHLKIYKSQPSWRPPGTMLETDKGLDGCFTSDWLESAPELRGWKLPPRLETTNWWAIAAGAASQRERNRSNSHKMQDIGICENAYCFADGSPVPLIKPRRSG
jgi:hypothetical protein